MTFLRIILSMIAAVSLTACSNTSEPVQLNTMKEGKPALWKVTGSKPEQIGTAYMFGTIHILPKNVDWRTPLLESAMKESDRLIIEVLGLEDTDNAAKIFAKLAISPNQPEIESRVKPSLRDDLDAVIDKSNIPEFALNRMESWAAALSLASAQTNALGLDSSEGVEKKLVAQFGEFKKPVEGLETIEQQLGYFDKLPESQQRDMLTSVVEEAADTKSAFEELFNAWISGDTDKIVELSNGGILEDPKTREKLLVARNQDWTEQLDKKLQSPGISFVAVGAAHLVGPDAVQAMLEKRGYKIEKIQ
ncbi:TraB/GumN family protein [Parasphingorhabdus litoris]|uniref:TraB/GumN family protein n=1 Tax=Parasphingorhabdus litoris TaxID=394733 RepID=A0ABN1ATH9_9SPHN|nr:TraB/GumN family protein [Parasphingorhabdus litoris]